MVKKILLGAHTSAAGGVHNALYEGRSIGATTIQLFTTNQRQWKGHHFSPEELQRWKEAVHETSINEVMSHASYLINIGSPVPDLLQKSRSALQEELQRCHELEISYLNFHPGSATGSGEEQCIATIIDSLLDLEHLAKQGSTRLLLETTAGQGTQIGCRFEQLGTIVSAVKDRLPIGICLDTCHVFAAGYDLRTPSALHKTLNEFDRIIGMQHLYALHLNDSLQPLGSHVDRHAPLGKGEIGLECFRELMTSSNTRYLPKYLETPEGPPGWQREIALLRSYATACET